MNAGSPGYIYAQLSLSGSNTAKKTRFQYDVNDPSLNFTLFTEIITGKRDYDSHP